MEKIKYENNFLELKVFFEDYETLNEGKPAGTRWHPEGKVFLYIMDLPIKDSDVFDKYAVSLLKKEYAVLNGETLDMDIYVPWGLANCSFIPATKFSKEFENFKVEPANEYFENMCIRLEFSSDSYGYGY